MRRGFIGNRIGRVHRRTKGCHSRTGTNLVTVAHNVNERVAKPPDWLEIFCASRLASTLRSSKSSNCLRRRCSSPIFGSTCPRGLASVPTVQVSSLLWGGLHRNHSLASSNQDSRLAPRPEPGGAASLAVALERRGSLFTRAQALEGSARVRHGVATGVTSRITLPRSCIDEIMHAQNEAGKGRG